MCGGRETEQQSNVQNSIRCKTAVAKLFDCSQIQRDPGFGSGLLFFCFSALVFVSTCLFIVVFVLILYRFQTAWLCCRSWSLQYEIECS